MNMHAKKTIFVECMKPGGFAEAIRENKVDEEGFRRRLIDAVNALASAVKKDESIDRLTIASLFECQRPVKVYHRCPIQSVPPHGTEVAMNPT